MTQVLQLDLKHPRRKGTNAEPASQIRRGAEVVEVLQREANRRNGENCGATPRD